MNLPLFSLLTALLLLGHGLTQAAEPAGDITEPEQALVGLSREVLQDLRPGSRQIEEAAAKATAAVRKAVEGKNATLKFTVRDVEKFQRKETPDVSRFRVRAVIDRVRESGVSMEVYLLAVPDVSENEKMAKVTRGSKVTFTGKISNAEILARKATELHIDLMDAKLK